MKEALFLSFFVQMTFGLKKMCAKWIGCDRESERRPDRAHKVTVRPGTGTALLTSCRPVGVGQVAFIIWVKGRFGRVEALGRL